MNAALTLSTDLRTWLAAGLGAVGRVGDRTVTLWPYARDDNRVWVAAQRTGYQGGSDCRPWPPLYLWAVLTAMGLDRAEMAGLAWEPLWDAEPTQANPFTAGRAS